MRLITIIVILCFGLSSIERKLNKVNDNLEKIVRLLEAKGGAK